MQHQHKLQSMERLTTEQHDNSMAHQKRRLWHLRTAIGRRILCKVSVCVCVCIWWKDSSSSNTAALPAVFRLCLRKNCGISRVPFIFPRHWSTCQTYCMNIVAYVEYMIFRMHYATTCLIPTIMLYHWTLEKATWVYASCESNIHIQSVAEHNVGCSTAPDVPTNKSKPSG